MSSKILLSPSETKIKKILKNDAITSELCEEKGADILVYSSQGLLGIQRKSLPGDFISSMTDGRFARSLPLLTTLCSYSVVLLEGKFSYWPDGTLHMGMMARGKRVPSRYNRDMVHGMLNDIQFMYCVSIRYTEDPEDTVRYIKSLQRYMNTTKHIGLFRRPKAQGAWNVPSKKDIHLWILQSFQGIGVSTADKIVSFYDRAPLCWTCSAEDLSSITGVSLKRSQEWINCLESDIGSTDINTKKTRPILEKPDKDSSSYSKLRDMLSNSK